MNRIQIACYCLVVTAVVLAGLLVVRLSQHTPTAEAGLVTSKDDIYMLTARAKQNEDALFVLDGRNEKLLVYVVDIKGARGVLELRTYIDVGRAFADQGTNRAPR